MTPKEYIIKFKMDANNQTKFDHREFLSAFAQEFDGLANACITYKEFQEVVSSMDQKFREIKSIRTKKKNLSYKIWKAFFAIYVVPKRKKMFPEEQAKIEAKRNGTHRN